MSVEKLKLVYDNNIIKIKWLNSKYYINVTDIIPILNNYKTKKKLIIVCVKLKYKLYHTVTFCDIDQTLKIINSFPNSNNKKIKNLLTDLSKEERYRQMINDEGYKSKYLNKCQFEKLKSIFDIKNI